MLDFILFCCLFHAPSYLYTYVALSHNSWEEPMVSVAQALNIPSLFHQNICFHASLDGQNPRLPSISAVSFSHAIILMLSTSTCWNSNKLLTHTDTQLPVQEVWHSHIPFSLSLHFCAPFSCNKKVSLHTFLLPVMLYTNKNTGCYLFVWLTDKARHQSIIPVSHTSTL